MHTRTAGNFNNDILIWTSYHSACAIMWPCAILVLFHELFIAESKSQVYAAIHELLRSHSSIANSLSKYFKSQFYT